MYHIYIYIYIYVYMFVLSKGSLFRRCRWSRSGWLCTRLLLLLSLYICKHLCIYVYR